MNGVNFALNDYGSYVHGGGSSARYGPDCGYSQDASGWSDRTGQGLPSFALASTHTRRLVLLDVDY